MKASDRSWIRVDYASDVCSPNRASKGRGGHNAKPHESRATLDQAGISAPKFRGTYLDEQNKEHPSDLLPVCLRRAVDPKSALRDLDDHGKGVFNTYTLGRAPKAVRELDEDEKGVRNTDTPGGVQNLFYVNESGLCKFIFKSRKPEATVFQKWITNGMLLAFRKTGNHSVAPKLPHEMSKAEVIQAQIENRGSTRRTSASR